MKFNYLLGAAVSSIALTVLVVVMELFEHPVKDILTAMFGHHWVTKIVLTLALFVAAGFALRNVETVRNIDADTVAWYSMLGSLAVIFLFFIVFYFIH